jgi:hypothetical protein
MPARAMASRVASSGLERTASRIRKTYGGIGSKRAALMFCFGQVLPALRRDTKNSMDNGCTNP